MITSVKIGVMRSSLPITVSLTSGTTRARSCENIVHTSSFSSPEMGDIAHISPVLARFVTLQIAADAVAEPSYVVAPSFETPPDNVGYVIPSVDKQGKFVATPVSLKKKDSKYGP